MEKNRIIMIDIQFSRGSAIKLIIICVCLTYLKALNPKEYSLFQTIQNRQLEASPFFSPGGNQLFIVEGGKATIYSLQGTKYVPVKQLSFGFTIQDACWSEDEEILAFRYFSSLAIYRESNGQYKSLQQITQDDIVPRERMGLRFCQNKQYLISPENSKVLIYKYDEEKQIYHLHQTLKGGKFPKISVTKDCSKILQANSKETLVNNLKEGKLISSFAFGNSQSKDGLKISADGSQVLISSNETLQIWKLVSGKYGFGSSLPSINTTNTHIKVVDNLQVVVLATNSSFTIFGKEKGQYSDIFHQNLTNIESDTIPRIDATQDGQKIVINYQTAGNLSKTLIFSTPRNIVSKRQNRFVQIILVFVSILTLVPIAIYCKRRKAIKKQKYQDHHKISHEDQDKMIIHK